MDPKEAIAIAKKYISEMFAGEGAMNIGLEELRYDDDGPYWLVTIGFTRAWEGPQGVARWSADGAPWPRTFKTVEINDSDGSVAGVRHWPVAA